jgi:hypothetical protein
VIWGDRCFYIRVLCVHLRKEYFIIRRNVLRLLRLTVCFPLTPTPLPQVGEGLLCPRLRGVNGYVWERGFWIIRYARPTGRLGGV